MLIRLLRTYLRPYVQPIALLMVLQLAQTIANLYLPTLNADIINNGVTKGDTNYIIRTGGLMLAVSLGQVICNMIAIYFGAKVAMSLGRDVRRAMFNRVQGFSTREVNQFGAPSLITRTTNDVQQVQMLTLMTFTIMIMAPIMLVGGVIMTLRQNARLSTLLLVIVPILGVLVSVIIWRMVPYFRAMQQKIDVINGVLREQITGIRVIRAFVRERHEEKRFAVANHDLFLTGLRSGRLMAIMFPAVMFVMNASTLAVTWFGGKQIGSGQMPIGDLSAFIQYLMYILMAVMMSTFMFMMVPRAAVSAERIEEVLDTASSVVEPTDPIAFPGRSGRIEFRNVEFRYPGAEAAVLHDVNFVAEPGKTTAIIGSTGSGKTTLLNLIPRLYDATGGQILVDGVDIRKVASGDVHSLIGLVPQKAYLFSGTIAENLRYGNADATEDALWSALEVAQAKDFVASLDEGLEAPVAQGGTNFSGGQRQRLAIARAIVRDPAIYLFDDSFSALDYATDARLRAALVPRTRNSAVLVVAQRVATIRGADQILVLDHGRVVGAGTHSELLESNETYQEIVYSQLSMEEAA